MRKLEGLENVQRIFRTLETESAERITNALNQGADEVADNARLLAPVRQGRLRASIVTDLIETERGVASRVLTRLFYARFVEFGTIKQTARPFFFPAYFAVRNRVRRRIAREVRRAMRFAAGARSRP